MNHKAIHPSKADKYSPNLYKWLTDRKKPYRLQSKVYKNDEGSLFVGEWWDNCFVGARLNRILCDGRKAGSFAWMFKVSDLAEVVDFWGRYERYGRCAIDPEHKTSFVGSDTRWLINGDVRNCLWCGNHKQRLHQWTECILRSEWRPDGALT